MRLLCRGLSSVRSLLTAVEDSPAHVGCDNGNGDGGASDGDDDATNSSVEGGTESGIWW